MDKDRHKRNYDLHSWTGVVLGIYLFIVCFTGAVAVFGTDIARWEAPETRSFSTVDPAPINDAFQNWVQSNAALGEIEHLSLGLPSDAYPYYRAFLDIHLDPSGSLESHVIAWRPQTLELFEPRSARLSDWLVGFHEDFKWPHFLGGSSVGGFVVGLAGIVLLLSIITGVVAHTKIREEAFTLRAHRSVRLRWQDMHKVIGLWGLPFHALIGFSGTILGVATLLAPIAAVLSYKGDVDALFAAFEGPVATPAHISAPMLDIDEAVSISQDKLGQYPLSIEFSHWGDQNASYTVEAPADKELMHSKIHRISGVNGDTIVLTPEQQLKTPGTRIHGALAPLHYGNFGGVALRFLWFGLGLSLSMIIALGTMMWIERRMHGNVGSRSLSFYAGLSRLNVGICAGLAFATSVLFLHNAVFNGPEDTRGNWIAGTYFCAWAFAIFYAFVRPGLYTANRELIGSSGLVLIAAALLNQVMTELPSRTGLFGHTDIALMDITIFSFGVMALTLAWKLPARRRQKHHPSSDATKL